MIERTTPFAGESEMELVNADIGIIVDELNKGIDPSQLPQGKISADKLRLSSPGTGSNAYSMNQTPAQVPANSQTSLTIGFNSPVAGVGLSAGQYFPASVYADFFLDPTGSGGASITGIYTSNTPGMGTGKVMTAVYLNNSVNTIANPNQIFSVTATVHNFDTVAHWVYVSVNVCVINTQSSTATT